MVALDLPGHGESGAGRDLWTMPAFGGDVVAVVEALGLEDVVLIGHSMGGDVIVEAALDLSGRVAGLVWADTYSTLGEPRSPAELEDVLRPFRADFVTATRTLVRQMFPPSADQDLVEWVARDMSSAAPDIALDALEHALGNDRVILDQLERLAAPVVAINPDYRPNNVQALKRWRVETVLMSGVGHFLMMEDPVTFNRLLGETVRLFKRHS